MKKIRKRRKPKHYTENGGYFTKEDFLKEERSAFIEIDPDFHGLSMPSVLNHLEVEARRLYKITSFKDVGIGLSDVYVQAAHKGWNPNSQFRVSMKIGDMNQEAIDYLWSSQEKENKRLITYYEKQLAKWQEWHDEFGEAYALQQKQKEENALKKEKAAAERALKAAQARLDKLKDKQ